MPTNTSRMTTALPPLCALEVKPIFATPPTHTCKAGDSKTFTINLETKIPEPNGDDYDISIPLNSQLVASCPKSVHVKQGESTLDLTVVAATGAGSGKVNIEIRERVHHGVITVTLMVEE